MWKRNSFIHSIRHWQGRKEREGERVSERGRGSKEKERRGEGRRDEKERKRREKGRGEGTSRSEDISPSRQLWPGHVARSGDWWRRRLWLFFTEKQLINPKALLLLNKHSKGEVMNGRMPGRSEPAGTDRKRKREDPLCWWPLGFTIGGLSNQKGQKRQCQNGKWHRRESGMGRRKRKEIKRKWEKGREGKGAGGRGWVAMMVTIKLVVGNKTKQCKMNGLAKGGGGVNE